MRAGAVDISGGRWHGDWRDDHDDGECPLVVSEGRRGGGCDGYDDGSSSLCEKRLDCVGPVYVSSVRGAAYSSDTRDWGPYPFEKRGGSYTPQGRATLTVLRHTTPRARPGATSSTPLMSGRGAQLERAIAAVGETRCTQPLGWHALGGWEWELLVRRAGLARR